MDKEELLRVWYEEVWGAAKFDRLKECVADTYETRDPGGHRIQTPAELADEIRGTHARIRGLRVTVDDVSTSADRIWTRWRMTGANAESGVTLDISALSEYRVENGRLAETWSAALPPGLGCS